MRLSITLCSYGQQRHSVILVISIILSSFKLSEAAKTEHLVFRADCQLVSDPFPVARPAEFQDFWSQASTRNLFLSAGGQRTCRSIENSAHTHDLWNKACQKAYGSEHLPQEGPNHRYSYHQDDPPTATTATAATTAESIMATDTEVKFPGFKMHNTVLNGCKLHRDEEGRPSYTFCLIGDHKAVKGNPSIVWLVKKLTGMSSVPKSHDEFSFEESETIAKTQIHIIPTANEEAHDNDENDLMKIQMTVQFATHVRFPEKFLNILPMPKEKVEQKGAHSIRKVVERDSRDALQAVREAWLLAAAFENDSTREQQDQVPLKIPVRQRIRSFRQRFAQARG